MSEQILIDVTGAVMTVRMNRPEKKNALTRAMYAEMTAALRRADEDAAVRVAVTYTVRRTNEQRAAVFVRGDQPTP